METVALLYEDYQKELAEDFKNTFLKRASDTDSSRSNDTVIDEVTDMLSTNIAVYTEKLLQRWGFSSGGEGGGGGGGGDVTVTLDDLLKKYLSDNYVTIKGDQEVFGEKDFRKGIRIAGRRLYWDEGNDALVIEGAAYTTRWLSAKGVSPGGGGAGSGGAAAMYQLIDVSPNDTKDAVLGAEKDYVLTFDGSFWRGMPNKGGLSSKLFTALDKEGNEVNPDDENAEIYAIRANYSLWSVGFLSAKGISDGGTGGGGGGAVALYQLLDVEKNADITGVAGATKGSVLTFNGAKWYADKPKTAAGISNLFTALDNDGNEVDLNDESKLGTITNIRANYALWSVDWISAKGKSSGGSGGGGGLINLVYGFESLGGTFDNNDNSATFNAFTINEIWKLASSGLTNVTVTGSGNAVTDVIKGSDGRSLTFTKGSTFATKSEFDALNTKFNDFLTGSDADDIINKWSELEVFLQGMKESDNLAVILQSKMDKTAFSKLFTALDASGNEVDPSDDTKTIASIRANFGFWGVDYISAKGVSMSGAQTGTLDSLNDVEITDPVNGQALKYDAASKKWVNGTIDSFNVNQMWSELKKADSSKVIDASHIPTSVLDGRWVKKTGDTMTGDLAMDINKGFYIPHGTGVAKTSGNWIHGGADVASSTDANLRFASWNGIGWYPSYSGGSVAQGNNAMWLDVRSGVLDVHSNITSHNGYLAANWDSARRLVLGTGSSYAWIDLRDSSDNSVLNNIVLDYSYTGTWKEMRAPYFKSIVGTGTQPYQCDSTTMNTNLNADMLDNWHLNFLPRNYNIGRCYAVRFALGGEDNGWKKIFACAESGTEPYKSVTVWGRIWYAYGNHAQEEVRYYHFCAIFYMRSGPSSSNSSVGNIENSARLYLPTFAKGMDNIRLVRVSTNYFEIQVRQIGSYHNANIEYQYWSYGCNVSAWENLQSTSNTSVAVSAGGASTLADSRASSADVWTTARTFYIQDYHSANTGAGVSVNGGSNCYLKLPSTTRFSRIEFATPNANIRHSGNDNGNEVGSSTLSNLVIDSWYGVSFTTTCSSTYQNKIAMSVDCRTGRVTANNFHAATNITANGAITAKASSSDIRLKTDIQGYDAMGIIRKFRSVKYHWNAVAKENSEVFNHDNWNYGLIAQDLLSGGYSQWVKDAFNDYYTIDYERLIPVVWKGLQEVDDEVTKLKREVARLNKRVKELEKSLCA